MTCSTCFFFFIKPGTNCLGVILPTVSWTLLLIKKMPLKTCIQVSWMEANFLGEVVAFQMTLPYVQLAIKKRPGKHSLQQAPAVAMTAACAFSRWTLKDHSPQQLQ